MKKKCPTLQQIRIDKLEKENRELKDKVGDWKFKFWFVWGWFLLHITLELIK